MPEGLLSDTDNKILHKVIELAKAEKAGEFEANGTPTQAYASYLTQIVRYATGEDRI